MPYFSDIQPFYDSLGELFVRLAADPNIKEKALASKLLVHFIYSDPEGEVWVETENPLGQMGYYIVSKGATGPFRVKIRSASFSNVSILPWLLRGVYVPDVITILGSLYFILGDIDR